MTHLRVFALDEKRIRVSGIEPLLAHCLFRLPEILEQRDHPQARARLSPDPLPGDAAGNTEWHEIVDGDLHHLFLSAGELVTQDLTTLTEGELTFPVEHLNAWMSALNQARLILSEIHGITEETMNLETLDFRQASHRAIVEIHLLGYLLHLLVEREQEPGAG